MIGRKQLKEMDYILDCAIMKMIVSWLFHNKYNLVLPGFASQGLKKVDNLVFLIENRGSLSRRIAIMSTSLLYHAFGIRGYKYQKTDFVGGEVIFTITQDPRELCCSNCGSRKVKPKGQIERKFRGLPCWFAVSVDHPAYFQSSLSQLWLGPTGKSEIC